MAVRVFHCDDSDAFRLLVREMLRDEPDIEVVGEAASSDGAIAGVGASDPDVVLLDLRGADLGPATVGAVHAAVPAAKIVVLSGWSGPIDAGPVAARLSKDLAFDQLAPTIRRVTASG